MRATLTLFGPLHCGDLVGSIGGERMRHGKAGKRALPLRRFRRLPLPWWGGEGDEARWVEMKRTAAACSGGTGFVFHKLV